MSQTIPVYKVALVFGVFDGFHPGHQHFLSEATQLCQKLVVVVAHPDAVFTLKNRTPHYTLVERIKKVRSYGELWEVIAGDQKIGTWNVLKKYQPDIILLGYDQTALGQELERMSIPHRFITAYHPDKYKSSLLNSDPTSLLRDSASA